ncbi:DUF222 domain-containing protein, partial [Leucobacter sp. M11]|uniref:DUF222 domain-containing protein n=1 Tax=Leucobacter sp. M11 TaxID=2993565 RepID=UPI002D808DBD
HAITGGLGAGMSRVGHLPEFADAERALVTAATASPAGLRHSADEVRVFVSRALAHLDPDGAAPTLAEQRASRGLRLTELSTGMTRVSGHLDPETAAIWHAVLTPTRRQLGREFAETVAGTDPGPPASGRVAFRPVRADAGAGNGGTNRDADADADGNGPTGTGTGPGVADTRTPAQRLLDRATVALTASLTVTDTDTGTSSLVHVHVRAEDLQTGRGIAWLDGVTAPISAGDAERMLCAGDVAATVFGEHGEILAQGRTHRLFTKRQVLALRARDGGCR